MKGKNTFAKSDIEYLSCKFEQVNVKEDMEDHFKNPKMHLNTYTGHKFNMDPDLQTLLESFVSDCENCLSKYSNNHFLNQCDVAAKNKNFSAFNGKIKII